MAQTIVIEQGDKNLQDVTKITPDTRVNFNAAKDRGAVLKYPVTDLNNGMTEETWTEDEVTFTNPHQIESASEETSEETSEDEDSGDDGTGV